MKNQILTLFLFLNISAFAQAPLTGSVSYENERDDAVLTSFPASTDYIKEAWENFAKDNFGTKPKGHGFLSNKDVLRIEEKVLEGLSTDPANLYHMIITNASGSTELRVFLSFDEKNKVSPNNSNDALFEKVKAAVDRFAKQTNTTWYAEVLDNERDAIKDDEKELKRTTQDLEKAEKQVRKNEKDIVKMREEMLELEEEILELNATIEEKRNAKTGLTQKLEERRRNLERLIQERDRATGN
jgi:predicted RNase H-like nuclease (RuvC/YqgF family)